MDTRGINNKYIHSLRLYTIMVWNQGFKILTLKKYWIWIWACDATRQMNLRKKII
jgi:hypothetical protein